MRRTCLLILLAAICSIPFALAEEISYGHIKQWRSHLAYTDVSQLADAGSLVFGRAGNAIFSVDKTTEEIQTFAKQNGLHGANICQIAYDKVTGQLLIAYEDGLFDIMSGGGITAITDLSINPLTSDRDAHHIYFRDGNAYLSMPFGILVVDMRKQEIRDTYKVYSSDVSILQTTIRGDSIYAISADTLFVAHRNDNLLDYHQWNRREGLPGSGNLQQLVLHDDTLYLLRNGAIWKEGANNTWNAFHTEYTWTHIIDADNQLFVSGQNYLYEVKQNALVSVPVAREIADAFRIGNTTWFAAGWSGIGRYNAVSGTQFFKPSGPYENWSYRMRFQGDKMIMVPGGYIVDPSNHPGGIMIYENDSWINWTQYELQQVLQPAPSYPPATPLETKDYCDAIIDPYDPNHYFVASHGYGLLEFRNNAFYHRYLDYNSPLKKRTNPEEGYTWVDGLAFDEDGNLWMLNNDVAGVKVLMRNGTWDSLENKATQSLKRTQDLLIWNQNPNIKIVSCLRGKESSPAIGIFNDNGTIAYKYDDRANLITSFVDQDGKTILPTYIQCVCQMADGSLWVGTDNGLFIFDDPTTMFTSNVCRRIKIPRNDGTNLADYLLGDESIHTIVEDGAGRKWIGTDASGLYLLSKDGMETIEHFTTDNSPLPSDYIRCLVIHPRTGEVFVGTGAGLVSYQSDAAAPAEDYDNVFSYPNPVRQNFMGYISITGLMSESVVYILDSGGNLVCKTRSNGGLAVWDGRNLKGKKVAPGIYTVLCNTADGKNHTVTKIMIM